MSTAAMASGEERARADVTRHFTEMEAIRQMHGENEATWPAGVLERYNRTATALERATDRVDALSERGERIAAMRWLVESGQATLESGFGDPTDAFKGYSGTVTRTGSPGDAVRAWAGYSTVGALDGWSASDQRHRAMIAAETMVGLEPTSRTLVTEMVARDRTAESSKAVLALANPAYRAAFEKWLVDPQSAAMTLTQEESAAWRDVQAVRAAMSESGPSALLPLQLDPSIVLANSGSSSGVRAYAKVRTAISNSYRAVTSPGITAEFKTEGDEAADASPTVTGVDVPVYFADASVKASYELAMDTDIAAQLSGLFADAFKQQEDRVFVLGAGSTEPFGAITRLSATTASRVSATTAGTFTTASGVDVFKLRDQVPVRFRQSPSVAWVSNIAIASVIQQIGMANAGLNNFWANLGSDTPRPSAG